MGVWGMPIIPATQEAEIGVSQVKASNARPFWAKVSETLSQRNSLAVVVYVYNPSYSGVRGRIIRA
jgi:hypothetical protein